MSICIGCIVGTAAFLSVWGGGNLTSWISSKRKERSMLAVEEDRKIDPGCAREIPGNASGAAGQRV